MDTEGQGHIYSEAEKYVVIDINLWLSDILRIQCLNIPLNYFPSPL